MEIAGMSGTGSAGEWEAAALSALLGAPEVPGTQLIELVLRLQELPGGSALAQVVGAVDEREAKTTALFGLVEATERLARWVAGRQMALIAELGERFEQERTHPSALPAELSAKLSLAPRTAQERVIEAGELRRSHPVLWKAVSEQGLDPRRAMVIAEQTLPLRDQLPTGQLDQLEERFAAQANGITLGTLRYRMRRAIARLTPVAVAEARHEAAAERRSVWLVPQEDGMAEFGALLPAAQAYAAMTVIDKMATAREPGESRNIDQRRADALGSLFTSMLDANATPLGMLPTAQRQRPHLLVTVEPRRPFRPNPAGGPPPPNTVEYPPEPLIELDGYGPITASAAKAALNNPIIGALILDPVTGERHHVENAPHLSVDDALAGRTGPAPPTETEQRNREGPAPPRSGSAEHVVDRDA